MHRPFVTTVKFESEHGDVVGVEYAVAERDTTDAKTELERRFLDHENRRLHDRTDHGSHYATGADA
jgi:hypothetical protein